MGAEFEKYAIIKDGKVFLKPFLNFPERELGEINEEDKTENYYVDRFNSYKTEVEELISKISAETNKGSFLSYLENLKNQIDTIVGVGDFEQLFKRINSLEVEISTQIRANRERNLSVKRGFIEELKELVKGEDTFLYVDRVKDIKNKWIRVGAVDEEYKEDLNKSFESLHSDFFERHKKAVDEQLVQYKDIIDESKKNTRR